MIKKYLDKSRKFESIKKDDFRRNFPIFLLNFNS